MECRKRTPGISILHIIPENWIPKDFSPGGYNTRDKPIHASLHLTTFPLLFIRADIMKKSRFVPTYLPALIKAYFCLASRLIVSNLYECAFSALLIHSSVTPSPFSIQVLTSKRNWDTFNPFSKEWLTEKGRITSPNYSCQDFYLLVSILILLH